jgi:hypothetical protein
LIFDQLSEECLGFIPQFLAHQYPTVRASAAEYMYLALQRMDLGRETDEAEEIILETEWYAFIFVFFFSYRSFMDILVGRPWMPMGLKKQQMR